VKLAEKIRDTLEGDFSARKHAEIMRLLDETAPEQLSLHERFNAIAYLQATILFGAKMIDAYKKDGHVDEKQFPDEIKSLNRLARATHYSAKMNGWMDENRKALVAALARDPAFMQGVKDWNRLNLAARGGLLKTLIRRQAQIYAAGAIPFAAPEVRIVSGRADADCWVAVPRIEKISGPADLSLNIGADFLREASAAQALMLAQHETVHHLTAQLALAARDGSLHRGHALYADAANRLARLQNHCNASSAIDSAYSSDGEETLAYAQCIRFGEEFFAGPGKSLKQRFMAAIDRILAPAETKPAQKHSASAPAPLAF
jgi:hypothetical protein